MASTAATTARQGLQLTKSTSAYIVNHLSWRRWHGGSFWGGNDFDTAYSIPIDRSTRLRFRLNATPSRTLRRDGGNIMLRPIADMPPLAGESACV